ncbi:MAG: hypothetical protein IPI66_15430 [Chitinophagaceae bacterium]|nr:hypothetical protein [Chitinophagaceae bacterium]
MEKTFKKDEFTAYLSVRDILNQNVGISRNFDSNTYNEVRNDRLKRYWMVGFTLEFQEQRHCLKINEHENTIEL